MEILSEEQFSRGLWECCKAAKEGVSKSPSLEARRVITWLSLPKSPKILKVQSLADMYVDYKTKVLTGGAEIPMPIADFAAGLVGLVKQGMVRGSFVYNDDPSDGYLVTFVVKEKRARLDS